MNATIQRTEQPARPLAEQERVAWLDELRDQERASTEFLNAYLLQRPPEPESWEI